MYNYCTLFDINYLFRGLCMYESLKKNAEKFHLYIYALCNESYEILKMLNLENCTIVSLNEFEDQELLKIKPTRTKVEYCWTCTPSIIKYSLEVYKLDFCTYVDADLYFFNNPNILVDEMNENDVSLTEHRYTKIYDQSKNSGIYCVQFMTFKNTENGLHVLNWWRMSCNEWCFARVENGKFGDQKYLDDWTDRFEGIYVIQNKFAGMAPWNIQQYDCNQKCVPIFYHFHNVKFLDEDEVYFGNYYLSKSVLMKLYNPYICHLYELKSRLSQDGLIVNVYDNYKLKKSYKKIIKKLFTYDMKSIFKIIWARLKKRNNNVFNIAEFVRK